MTLKLEYAFTLRVDLEVAQNIGKTAAGDRRFIPIAGGRFEGPRLRGEILPGGGDWNAVRPDSVVHVFAKYTIRTDDGVLINVTNEGYGRASQSTMERVFANESAKLSEAGGDERWYTKTFPRFEVADGKYAWLNNTCFVGDLLPPAAPKHVVIEVYEIL